MPFDQFTEVLRVAFDDGGASGLHRGTLGVARVAALAGAERRTFLDTVARPRLDTLRRSPPTGPAVDRRCRLAVVRLACRLAENSVRA